jgi:hypothetical protein
MSGSRRKAQRKGHVLLAGVRARTLRGVNWHHEPKEPTIRPSKPAPRQHGEPKPGSRKAKLAEKRALGWPEVSPEEKAKAAARAELRCENDRRAKSESKRRKLQRDAGLPVERKNRVVFGAGR